MPNAAAEAKKMCTAELAELSTLSPSRFTDSHICPLADGQR